MKLKLDENIGARGRGLLVAAGFDASTVFDQGMTGFDDQWFFAWRPGFGFRIFMTHWRF
jgi:hypothetical protein